MIDLLILAAALAQSAAPSPAAPTSSGVRFVARIAYPDGRTEERTLTTIVGGLTSVRGFYASVPSSVCEGLRLSESKPPSGSRAWYVSIGPVKYSADTRARVRAEVMITAQDTRNLADMQPVALPTQTTQRAADIVSVTGLKPVSGCNAVAVTLQARLLPEPVEVKAQSPAQPKLMEAELWFVHKAPDGKETAQKQTLRMRAPTSASSTSHGDFYFDDIVVNATLGDRTEPITVEVFGSVILWPQPSAGADAITARLFLTRRYINPKAAAVGVPPTVGSGTHDVTLTPTEVVSFVLPPIEQDKGQFVGHRFSVRIRVTPVTPEQN